eukprot:g45767.t1
MAERDQRRKVSVYRSVSFQYLRTRSPAEESQQQCNPSAGCVQPPCPCPAAGGRAEQQPSPRVTARVRSVCKLVSCSSEAKKSHQLSPSIRQLSERFDAGETGLPPAPAVGVSPQVRAGERERNSGPRELEGERAEPECVQPAVNWEQPREQGPAPGDGTGWPSVTEMLKLFGEPGTRKPSGGSSLWPEVPVARARCPGAPSRSEAATEQPLSWTEGAGSPGYKTPPPPPPPRSSLPLALRLPWRSSGLHKQEGRQESDSLHSTHNCSKPQAVPTAPSLPASSSDEEQYSRDLVQYSSRVAKIGRSQDRSSGSEEDQPMVHRDVKRRSLRKKKASLVVGNKDESDSDAPLGESLARHEGHEAMLANIGGCDSASEGENQDTVHQRGEDLLPVDMQVQYILEAGQLFEKINTMWSQKEPPLKLDQKEAECSEGTGEDSQFRKDAELSVAAADEELEPVKRGESEENLSGGKSADDLSGPESSMTDEGIVTEPETGSSSTLYKDIPSHVLVRNPTRDLSKEEKSELLVNQGTAPAMTAVRAGYESVAIGGDVVYNKTAASVILDPPSTPSSIRRRRKFPPGGSNGSDSSNGSNGDSSGDTYRSFSDPMPHRKCAEETENFSVDSNLLGSLNSVKGGILECSATALSECTGSAASDLSVCSDGLKDYNTVIQRIVREPGTMDKVIDEKAPGTPTSTEPRVPSLSKPNEEVGSSINKGKPQV